MGNTPGMFSFLVSARQVTYILQYEPEPDSDEDSDQDSPLPSEHSDNEGSDDAASSSGKRRHVGNSQTSNPIALHFTHRVRKGMDQEENAGGWTIRFVWTHLRSSHINIMHSNLKECLEAPAKGILLEYVNIIALGLGIVKVPLKPSIFLQPFSNEWIMIFYGNCVTRSACFISG